MDNRGLYQTILGLQPPWDVERVELRETDAAVDVWVGPLDGTTFTCPECAQPAAIHDHVERRWRHLDTCQFRTMLGARVPRVRCATHGVVTVPVPWPNGDPASRCSSNVWPSRGCRRPRLRRSRVGSICRGTRRAASWSVRRGLQRRQVTPVAHLGLDEKSFLRRHQYVSVVADLDDARILHVADDRKASSLSAYFTSLTREQRSGIAAVAMDMWEPYRKTVRAHVPDADAKIVFDKFYVLQHMGAAVDQVRRQEHRALVAVGDRRLTRTKYQWLRNPLNFSRQAWRAFATLRDSTLQSARAWALKESLRPLWNYRYVGAARNYFRWWYGWAMRSRLAPVKKVARKIKAHLENILTYLTHRITNAVTEGLNAKIQWIKYSARGSRNREAFKMAVYFHCGKLDLDPRQA